MNNENQTEDTQFIGSKPENTLIIDQKEDTNIVNDTQDTAIIPDSEKSKARNAVEQPKAQKGKSKVWIAWVAGIVVLLGGGAAAYFFLFNNNGKADHSDDAAFDNFEQIGQMMRENERSYDYYDYNEEAATEPAYVVEEGPAVWAEEAPAEWEAPAAEVPAYDYAY